jgi:hypothetical protein
MTTKTEDAGIDIADLDACAHCDDAVRVRVPAPRRLGLGRVPVRARLAVRQGDGRGQPADQRPAPQGGVQAATGGRAKTVDFTPVEDDIAFGQRLSAARLVGWRGIKQAYTPDLALKLCQSNAELSSQVLAASNDLGNFTPASPKT